MWSGKSLFRAFGLTSKKEKGPKLDSKAKEKNEIRTEETRGEKDKEDKDSLKNFDRSNPLTKSSSDDAATLNSLLKMRTEEEEAAITSTPPPAKLQTACSALTADDPFPPTASLMILGVSLSGTSVGVVEEKANILLKKKKNINPADLKHVATQTLPRKKRESTPTWSIGRKNPPPNSKGIESASSDSAYVRPLQEETENPGGGESTDRPDRSPLHETEDSSTPLIKSMNEEGNDSAASSSSGTTLVAEPTNTQESRNTLTVPPFPTELKAKRPGSSADAKWTTTTDSKTVGGASVELTTNMKEGGGDRGENAGRTSSPMAETPKPSAEDVRRNNKRSRSVLQSPQPSSTSSRDDGDAQFNGRRLRVENQSTNRWVPRRPRSISYSSTNGGSKRAPAVLVEEVVHVSTDEEEEEEGEQGGDPSKRKKKKKKKKKKTGCHCTGVPREPRSVKPAVRMDGRKLYDGRTKCFCHSKACLEIRTKGEDKKRIFAQMDPSCACESQEGAPSEAPLDAGQSERSVADTRFSLTPMSEGGNSWMINVKDSEDGKRKGQDGRAEAIRDERREEGDGKKRDLSRPSTDEKDVSGGDEGEKKRFSVGSDGKRVQLPFCFDVEKEPMEYFAQTRGISDGSPNVDRVEVSGQLKGSSKGSESEEAMEFCQVKGVANSPEEDAGHERYAYFSQTKGSSRGVGMNKRGGSEGEQLELYSQTKGKSKGEATGLEADKEEVKAFGRIKGVSEAPTSDDEGEKNGMEKAVAFVQLRGIPQVKTAIALLPTDEACRCEAVIYSQGNEEEVTQAKKEWFGGCECMVCAERPDQDHIEKEPQLTESQRAYHVTQPIVSHERDSAVLQDGKLSKDLQLKKNEVRATFKVAGQDDGEGEKDGTEKVVAFVQLRGIPEAWSNEGFMALLPTDEACRCEAVFYLRGNEEQIAQAKKEWLAGCDCVVCTDCDDADQDYNEQEPRLLQTQIAHYATQPIDGQERLSNIPSVHGRNSAILQKGQAANDLQLAKIKFRASFKIAGQDEGFDDGNKESDGMEKAVAYGQLRGIPELKMAYNDSFVALLPADEVCRCETVIFVKGSEGEIAQAKKEWLAGCECTICIECDSTDQNHFEKEHQLIDSQRDHCTTQPTDNQERLSNTSLVHAPDNDILEEGQARREPSLMKDEMRAVFAKGGNEGTEKAVAFGLLRGLADVKSSMSNEGVEALLPTDEGCPCETVVYVKGTEEEITQAEKERFACCECAVCTECDDTNQDNADKKLQLINQRAHYEIQSMNSQEGLSHIPSVRERYSATLQDGQEVTPTHTSSIDKGTGFRSVEEKFKTSQLVEDDCQCNEQTTVCECYPEDTVPKEKQMVVKDITLTQTKDRIHEVTEDQKTEISVDKIERRKKKNEKRFSLSRMDSKTDSWKVDIKKGEIVEHMALASDEIHLGKEVERDSLVMCENNCELALTSTLSNHEENAESITIKQDYLGAQESFKQNYLKSETVCSKMSKKAQIGIPPTVSFESNKKLTDPEISCKCDLVAYAKGNQDDKERLEKEFTEDCECCNDAYVNITKVNDGQMEETEEIVLSTGLVTPLGKENQSSEKARFSLSQIDSETDSWKVDKKDGEVVEHMVSDEIHPGNVVDRDSLVIHENNCELALNSTLPYLEENLDSIAIDQDYLGAQESFKKNYSKGETVTSKISNMFDCDGCTEEQTVLKSKVPVVDGGAKKAVLQDQLVDNCEVVDDVATAPREESSGNRRPICTLYHMTKLAEESYHLTQDANHIGATEIKAVDTDVSEIHPGKVVDRDSLVICENNCELALNSALANVEGNTDSIEIDQDSLGAQESFKEKYSKSETVSSKISSKAQIGIPPTVTFESNETFTDPKISCKCNLVISENNCELALNSTLPIVKGNTDSIAIDQDYLGAQRSFKENTDMNVTNVSGGQMEEVEHMDISTHFITPSSKENQTFEKKRSTLTRMDEAAKTWKVDVKDDNIVADRVLTKQAPGKANNQDNQCFAATQMGDAAVDEKAEAEKNPFIEGKLAQGKTAERGVTAAAIVALEMIPEEALHNTFVIEGSRIDEGSSAPSSKAVCMTQISEVADDSRIDVKENPIDKASDVLHPGNVVVRDSLVMCGNNCKLALTSSLSNHEENTESFAIKRGNLGVQESSKEENYFKSKIVRSKMSKNVQIGIPPTVTFESNRKFTDPEISCKCDLVAYAKGNQDDKARLEKELTKDCDCCHYTDVNITNVSGGQMEEAEEMDLSTGLVTPLCKENQSSEKTRFSLSQMDSNTDSWKVDIKNGEIDGKAEVVKNPIIEGKLTQRKTAVVALELNPEVALHNHTVIEGSRVDDGSSAPSLKTVCVTQMSEVADDSRIAVKKNSIDKDNLVQYKNAQKGVTATPLSTSEAIPEVALNNASMIERNGVDSGSFGPNTTATSGKLRNSEKVKTVSGLNSEDGLETFAAADNGCQCESMVNDQTIADQVREDKRVPTTQTNDIDDGPRVEMESNMHIKDQLQQDSVPQTAVNTVSFLVSETSPETAQNNAAATEDSLKTESTMDDRGTANRTAQKGVSAASLATLEMIPEVAMDNASEVGGSRPDGGSSAQSSKRKFPEKAKNPLRANLKEESETLPAAEDGCKCSLATYAKAKIEEKEELEAAWTEDCDCDGCAEERKAVKYKVAVMDGGAKMDDVSTTPREESLGNRRPICTLYHVTQLAEESYHLTQDAINIGATKIDTDVSAEQMRRSSSREKLWRSSMSTQTAEQVQAEKFVCTCKGAVGVDERAKEEEIAQWGSTRATLQEKISEMEKSVGQIGRKVSQADGILTVATPTTGTTGKLTIEQSLMTDDETVENMHDVDSACPCDLTRYVKEGEASQMPMVTCEADCSNDCKTPPQDKHLSMRREGKLTIERSMLTNDETVENMHDVNSACPCDLTHYIKEEEESQMPMITCEADCSDDCKNSPQDKYRSMRREGKLTIERSMMTNDETVENMHNVDSACPCDLTHYIKEEEASQMPMVTCEADCSDDCKNSPQDKYCLMRREGKSRSQPNKVQAKSITLECLERIPAMAHACPCELIRFHATVDDSVERPRLEPIVPEAGCVDCLCKKLKKRGLMFDSLEATTKSQVTAGKKRSSAEERRREEEEEESAELLPVVSPEECPCPRSEEGGAKEEEHSPRLKKTTEREREKEEAEETVPKSVVVVAKTGIKEDPSGRQSPGSGFADAEPIGASVEWRLSADDGLPINSEDESGGRVVARIESDGRVHDYSQVDSNASSPPTRKSSKKNPKNRVDGSDGGDGGGGDVRSSRPRRSSRGDRDSLQSFPWLAAGVGLLVLGYAWLKSWTAPEVSPLPDGGAGSGPILVGPGCVRKEYRVPVRRFPVKVMRLGSPIGAGEGISPL